MEDHVEGIWEDLGGKYRVPDTGKKQPFENISVIDDNKITQLIYKRLVIDVFNEVFLKLEK